MLSIHLWSKRLTWRPEIVTEQSCVPDQDSYYRCYCHPVKWESQGLPGIAALEISDLERHLISLWIHGIKACCNTFEVFLSLTLGRYTSKQSMCICWKAWSRRQISVPDESFEAESFVCVLAEMHEKAGVLTACQWKLRQGASSAPPAALNGQLDWLLLCADRCFQYIPLLQAAKQQEGLRPLSSFRWIEQLPFGSLKELLKNLCNCFTSLSLIAIE